jgi:ATP-dependent helicase/nuclease subunit A
MLLNNLVDKKILTENQKSEIPKDKILMFAKSELFEEIRNAKEVYKEQPFYINVPLKEVYGKDIDEEILVQGIIDLYFVNETGDIILVDYKTDYVPNDDNNYLKEKYKEQLNLYKRAIEQALERKVTHTYIYSIFLGEKIEV